MPSDQPTQAQEEWVVENTQPGRDDLTVTTYARKARRYDVVSTTDSFIDIAYNRFDLEQVCRILLHENRSFRGHKDALAAALCGWMLDPMEWVPRQRLVALSIGTTLARAEQAATRRSAARDNTRHYYPRKTRLSPAFFDQLYYPIGGLRKVVRTPTHHGLYRELTTQRGRSYDTTMIAAIDHYQYHSTMAGVVLDNLSFERSCKVYVLVEMALSGFLPPNVANLKGQYLSKVEKSIPFLYAASTIRLSETRTLLHAIAAAQWSTIIRPGILPELLGRTLAYTQTVYIQNNKAKKRANFAQDISAALRGVEPRAFAPPNHVSACERIIKHGYTEAGYAACCHGTGKFRWNSPAFWSALNLPIPECRGRSRRGSITR